MIYRVLYDGIDIHTNSVPDVLINPTVETEMNTAGSFSFTLPPDHFAWGDIYVFKGNVEVYENNDLIFFGRVANVDQNWNNERIVECEGALAFFNDSIQRPNSWTSNTLISQFLSDILDNHNAQVPDDRKIYLGNVTIDDMYVTRETNYEKTLDVLTRMCIDTNGGYFSLRKDEDDGKIYLDWLKDLTDIAAQPVEFGLNLLDISKSLHAEDIVTGVLARGAEVNDVKIDLHEVGEIDDPSSPVIHHTNLDPDILWHRDGLEGYGRVVQVKEFNDCTTVDGDNGLLAKATEWLIKQNTDIDTIEVDAAELGYFGESYPIFLLGQKVIVNSHPHHLENVELPMYKISMNLDSGTKRISIGTPPKRELTQISASNMGGGSGSGSSSGGGSGSGGVQDVRVNGTSVVQDGIARVNVPTDTVTESEMNTAISTAVSGKANQSDLESLATTVAGKANTSEVTAALALKADKTEIPEIEANPSDAATDTLNKIDIEGTVYQLAGGTQVEANPVEAATDDLETIKIGDTVYDIPGSGGSTNYGKFKCDVLFDTPASSTSWNSPIEICDENVAKEYDMLNIMHYSNSSYPNQTVSNIILVKDIGDESNGNYNVFFRTNNNMSNIDSTIFATFNNGKLYVYTNPNKYIAVKKVYGLKFENKLINRSDIYSEEERMIGRWTDGKPLYQKTINTGTLPNATTKTIAHGISNIETICNIFGYAYNGDVTFSLPLSYNYNDINLNTRLNANNTYIYLTNNRDRTNFIKSKVTLQYTKTTDTADSGVLPEDPMFISDPMIYSEEEQVVGSWTDGKPLYQKTVTISSVSYDSSWHEIDHNISDIDVIGSVEGVVIESNGAAYYSANTPRPGYTLGFLVGATKTKIEYINNWLNSASKLIVTLQYTKTTDSILSGPKKGKIVQRSDIYSEEERLVGRWTDGKPLYQKTWNGLGLTIPQIYWQQTSISMSDMDYWQVISNKNDGTNYDNQYSMLYRKINNLLQVFCPYEIPLDSLTIQYTKTTDLPFSKQLIEDPQFVMMSDIYSEDEQVVGRWTDGKPLYQKNIPIPTIQSAQSGIIISNLGLDIDNCVDIKVHLYKDTAPDNDTVIATASFGDMYFYYRKSEDSIRMDAPFSWVVGRYGNLTLQYTKTTDAPGTGPTKGNLIYLPALYSEEEREVGVWTDGKPIYQKTFLNIALQSGISNVFTHNLGIDKYIDFSGRCCANGDGWSNAKPFPYYQINWGGYIDILSWDTNSIAFNSKWNSSYVDITIQYTKTTDQPGSGTWTPEGQLAHHYSTSEKIVGTWIDGSTIYERTIQLTANLVTNDTSWTQVQYDNPVTNMSHLIDCKTLDGTETYLLERFSNNNQMLSAASKYSGTAWNTGTYMTIRYTKSS